MMHQSEFDAANVALSRAADKRKSLINNIIHKNRYTATLKLVLYNNVFWWPTTSSQNFIKFCAAMPKL